MTPVELAVQIAAREALLAVCVRTVTEVLVELDDLRKLAGREEASP